MKAARAGRADWKVRLLYGALGIAILLWYFHLFMGRYIDDAFITLSYASTLAKFGVWGMAPDLTSNAATSPLNVMLLAATIKVFGDPLIALWIFNVLLGLLIYSSLRYFSLKIFGSELFGLLATALLLTNPLLASTQGLESYLLIGLVLLACQLWDLEDYRWLGVVLGALFLTRPDAFVVAFVFVGLLVVRRQWKVVLEVTCIFLAITLPWLAYSWYHLGSLFPDTLLIKLGQGSWEGTSFEQGPLLYWMKYPTATLLSLSLAPGLFYLRNVRKMSGPRMSLLLGLGSYAVLHFVAYAILKVPPYHWYYAVETSAIVVFGPLAIFEASARFRSANIALLLGVIVLSAGCTLGAVSKKGAPPISTNWGTESQYKLIADWLNANISDKRIRTDTELGTMQYFTNADTIDEFSDRSPIVKMLQKPHSRVAATLLRWNYRQLRVEDFSQIRYGLSLCRPETVPLKQWRTETIYNGPHEWCVYKISTPAK